MIRFLLCFLYQPSCVQAEQLSFSWSLVWSLMELKRFVLWLNFFLSRQNIWVFLGNKSFCNFELKNEMSMKWIWGYHTYLIWGYNPFALSWLLNTYESAQIKLFSRLLVSTNYDYYWSLQNLIPKTRLLLFSDIKPYTIFLKYY